MAAYILTLLLMVEAILRLSISLIMGVPFLKPNEVIYRYYPVVKEIEKRYAQTKPGTFKILILSCSTLHNEWGGFKPILEKKLLEPDTINGLKDQTDYAVFNASGIGFSSIDNFYCYKLLSNLKFDLIVYYAGINDSRFNNCPELIYRNDYSHITWNNEINCIERHPEMNCIVTPFVIDYLYQLVYQNVFRDRFIPVHYTMRPSWWSYGAHLISLLAFKHNTEAIAKLCKEREGEILFVPYCYYIPVDYTIEKFKNKKLDYAFQPNSRETEIWGYPANVSSFLDSAAIITRNIAMQGDGDYLDIRAALHRNIYFADVCHFSPAGLITFSDLISQEIRKKAALR